MPLSLQFDIPPDKLKFKDGPEVIKHHERRQRSRAYNKYKKDKESTPKEAEISSGDLATMQDETYVRRMIEWMYLDRIKIKEAEENYGAAQLTERMQLDPLDYYKDPSYYPYAECSTSLKRMLLAKDITAGGAAIPKNIAVFCDMPMKTTDLIFTQAFEYIDQPEYILTPQQKVDFKKPVISCNCNGKCVPETCACMKLNMECYGKYLKLAEDGRLMEVFGDESPDQRVEPHERFLVMCGEFCGCGEECGHHVRQLTKKEHNFEVVRDHKRRGFQLRVMNPVEMGEILCEVIGTVTPLSEIDGIKSKEKYSWRLFNNRSRFDLARLYKASGCRNIPASCRPEKIDKWFIETCYQGNIARFINNGCFRNVAPIRVIANYLHPVYHRIFVMSMAPIPIGATLMMNYRQTVQYPIKKCRCGSHICPNKPFSRSFVRSMSSDEFRATVLEIYKRLQDNVDTTDTFYAEEDTDEIPINRRAKYSPHRVILRRELSMLRETNEITSKVGDLQMQIRMLRAIQNGIDVDPTSSGLNNRQLKKEYNMYEEEVQKLKQQIRALHKKKA